MSAKRVRKSFSYLLLRTGETDQNLVFKILKSFNNMDAKYSEVPNKRVGPNNRKTLPLCTIYSKESVYFSFDKIRIS